MSKEKVESKTEKERNETDSYRHTYPLKPILKILGALNLGLGIA